jgi:hypothetical protein
MMLRPGITVEMLNAEDWAFVGGLCDKPLLPRCVCQGQDSNLGHSLLCLPSELVLCRRLGPNRELEIRLAADVWFVAFLEKLEATARGFTDAGRRQRQEDDDARF